MKTVFVCFLKYDGGDNSLPLRVFESESGAKDWTAENIHSGSEHEVGYTPRYVEIEIG